MQENWNSNSLENGGVKASMHFIKAIENFEVEELKNILELEAISKVTLGAGLMKALLNYRNNSDSIDIIDSLLTNNVDPNYIVHYKTPTQQVTTAEKVTILMYACHKGDLQLIHTILKHNPNVNLKDANNRNSLFYAINADKGDNADVVLTLINSGINVNDPEKETKDSATAVAGHSPLTLATQKNLKNTVKALLDNAADPDWTVFKDGNTALHYAVKNSNIAIIQILLLKNANLRAINKDNYTPLSLALKLSHTDIYKSLCEEHNKIVKKENEMASSIILENPNNNSTKKKKKQRDMEPSKGENDDLKTAIQSKEDTKNDLKYTESVQTDTNLKEAALINPIQNAYPNVKKKNPKLELISKIKELKLNNLKNENLPSNQNNVTTSKNSCILEVPFEINRKINEANQSKIESYISR